MGFNQSKKEPKPMFLGEHTIQIKCSYISHAKQVYIDREVNNLEHEERRLLKKYGPEARTLDNMLFKDELMMNSIAVRRITAIKKILIYVRFLENARKFISDSRQNFDVLPESSKASIKNIVFAAAYICDKDIHEFATLMKHYYWRSPHVKNALTAEDIDPELRRECMIIKNQSIPDAELIDFYIEYMRRNHLEPICGNFGKQPRQTFNAPPPQGGNNFGGPNNGGQYQGNQQIGQNQQIGYAAQNQQPIGSWGTPPVQGQQFQGLNQLQQQHGGGYQPNQNNPFGGDGAQPYQPPVVMHGKVEGQMKPQGGNFQGTQAPVYGEGYPMNHGGYNAGPNPFENTANYNAYNNAQQAPVVKGQAEGKVGDDDFMSQLENLRLGDGPKK